MDQELKQKWVDALRSGNYEQTTRQLRGSEDKFCCLGVLANIVDPDAWELRGNTWLWNGSAMVLPRITRKELGFVEYQDHRSDEYRALEQGYYSAMNDAGKSFSDLADEIEQNL